MGMVNSNQSKSSQTVSTIISNSAINIATTIRIKSRYDKEVRDTLQDTVHLGDRYTLYVHTTFVTVTFTITRFSGSAIRHAIGLLNVNAVCLQFPKICGAPCTEASAHIYQARNSPP